jgi:hypothetical protein
MRWSLASSDNLAALRRLVLIGGWDTYWVERQGPSLVAEVA